MKSNVLGQLTFIQFKLVTSGSTICVELKKIRGLPDSDVLLVTIDPTHEDVLHMLTALVL